MRLAESVEPALDVPARRADHLGHGKTRARRVHGLTRLGEEALHTSHRYADEIDFHTCLLIVYQG